MKEEALAELPLSPSSWEGSYLASECSLHQVAPYIGKTKSGMAKALIRYCSKPGDIILDPFVGSGTVALESLIEGRGIICSDINPYAIALTKAKLFAPSTVDQALTSGHHYLSLAEGEAEKVDISEIPEWVAQFYHPRTLREIIALATLLRKRKQHFLMGCLLGILHHQRPGFLSYPACHAVPYLRTTKYPKDKYPSLYEYRPVRPRLLNKIQRVYRRFPSIDRSLRKECYFDDATHLQIEDCSIDAIVTSPPYMDALDYVRDNRLRLWFLGCDEKTQSERNSLRNIQEFEKLMDSCLRMIQRILRPNKRCVMVIGEVNRYCHAIDTSEILLTLAEKVGGLECETIMEDSIPEDRRVRKNGLCTRREWIIVLRNRP